MSGSFFVHLSRFGHRYRRMILSIFILKTVIYSTLSFAQQQQYDLILAGGSLSTCSSMSVKNCRNNDFKDSDLGQLKYAFSSESAAKFLQMATFWPSEQAQFLQLHSLLLKAYSAKQGLAFTRNQFWDALVEQGVSEADIRALPDSAYFALLDTHELRQLNNGGQRKQERAVVEWNISDASRAVYQAFIDQATLRANDHVTSTDSQTNGSAQRPRIAVVTASSRDPFESADFYISAFESMGADVVWLPLDASFQYARWLTGWGVNGCEQLERISAQFTQFDRARVYPKRAKLRQQYCQQPELLNDLLNNVNGIFFNGGDQSRTLSALLTPDGKASEQLAIIRSRVTDGQIVVGGTSAGTAVQAGGFLGRRPIPMLTNGDSRHAIVRGAIPVSAPSARCSGDCTDGLVADDLTYRPQGGSALFSLGLLDTHFSERDREARLIAFTEASQQRFAFGVDETTALLVDYHSEGISLGVVGEAGVFVVDRAHAQNSYVLDAEAAVQSKQLSGTAHFLIPGMRMHFEHGAEGWRFESQLHMLEKRKKLRALESGEWRNQLRNWCASEKQLAWTMEGYVVVVKANQQTQFFTNPDAATPHCGYVGLPFVLHGN